MNYLKKKKGFKTLRKKNFTRKNSSTDNSQSSKVIGKNQNINSRKEIFILV